MTDFEPGPASAERPPTPPAPAGLVRRLYRDEWAMWKAHYRRYFIISARVLALGFVLGFLYFLLWPAQEKRALLFVVKQLKDIPLGAPPLVLALTIFYHNVRASILAVAAGIVPLACFPILDPLMNGAILGLLASLAKHQGLNVPLLFLKSVAPHGVFELAAVLYATSTGVYLSVSLGKYILARLSAKRPETRPGTEERKGTAQAAGSDPGNGSEGRIEPESCRESEGGFLLYLLGRLGCVVRSFLLVVLPLLAVAAFIEGFITPRL